MEIIIHRWFNYKAHIVIPLVKLGNIVVAPNFFSLASTRFFSSHFQASNILFVDQPTGTGFSYSSDASDIRNDEVGISNDLYDFLQVIIDIKSLFHPSYLFECIKLPYMQIYRYFNDFFYY